MNILTIDTSSSHLLVALRTNTNTYFNEANDDPKHLETLLPEIQNLLYKANLQVKNIDIIGIVVGPGSFTGIRIGVATAKAFMCSNKNMKCVAVNSLDLLAYNTISKSNTIQDIICVIPSTLKKFYVGVFHGVDRIMQDKLMEVDELKEFVTNSTYKVICPLGTRLDFYKSYEEVQIDNADLIAFVERAKIDDNFVSLNNLKPYYLGLSQAEMELIKKEKANGTNI